MIVVNKSKSRIPYKYVWFADRPRHSSALDLVFFAQCKYDRPVLGFKRQTFYTKIIDLREPAETILKRMSSRSATEVRRAKREGIEVRGVENVDDFIAFYNPFANGKGLGTVAQGELAGWGAETVGLAAFADRAAVAMHSYIVDREEGRARLLHSASSFREQAGRDERAIVARANRLLHYEAMLHFKASGIEKYDLGGYALNSEDPQLANIAKFKDTLGGELVREDHYVSAPLYLLQRLAAAVSPAGSAPS